MSDNEACLLECQVTLEYLDKNQGFVARKQCYKSSLLRLVRNEFREMFLEVNLTSEKRNLRYQLRGLSVHKKFMNEGKATIMFGEEKVNVMISNAPPSRLFEFLKLMALKLMSNNDATKTTRTKLLSTKAQTVDDISPLTEVDLSKAKEKYAKGKETTPVGAVKTFKRPLQVNNSDLPVKAKKKCLMTNEPLCGEQKEILESARRGESIFFTGSAGTGKSYLLRQIISSLPPDVTFATASTGVAACQIGGTTLHQFAGIGRGEGTFEHCITLASKPNVKQVWRKCRHLVIDEISMIHGDFFEKLEHIARVIRNNERPFGGIQLILCGDFFQLPPVSDKSRFCFETSVWDKCIDRSFELLQVHRQSDPKFVDLLQSIRIGRVTENIKTRLTETATQDIEREGILATRLCTHTADAVSINEHKLKSLPSEGKLFKSIDEPSCYTSVLDKQSPVTSQVVLKEGAQVMLMKNLNISEGLVNGARGVILKFDKDGMPIVKFVSGVHKIRREKFTLKLSSGVTLARVQIPLNLAWAFSIHKSQGLTLDCVEMCLSRVFEPGHAYVALSRVKNLESIRVLDFDSKQVWANPKVLTYYQKFRRRIQCSKFIPLGRS